MDTRSGMVFDRATRSWRSKTIMTAYRISSIGARLPISWCYGDPYEDEDLKIAPGAQVMAAGQLLDELHGSHGVAVGSGQEYNLVLVLDFDRDDLCDGGDWGAIEPYAAVIVHALSRVKAKAATRRLWTLCEDGTVDLEPMGKQPDIVGQSLRSALLRKAELVAVEWVDTLPNERP